MQIYSKFIVALTLLFGLSFSSCKNTSNTSKENLSSSTFQKIIKKGQIDVGYINYPPGFIIDANTNEYSGIFQEVLAEIAKRNNLKLNYKAPVTWATMIQDVNLGKVDMLSSPVWATATRKEVADFTSPVYFSPIGVFVRDNDNRFEKNYSKINDPNIKIAAVQGEVNNEIGKTDFPLANLDPFTDDVDVSQLFLEIKTGRKDVTFAEPMFAHDYIQKNPNTIKNIGLTNPIRNYPNSFLVKKGEKDLIVFLNSEIRKLATDGTIDLILERYSPFKGAVISITDSLAIAKF